MPVNGWQPTLWSSPWRLLLIAKRQMGVLCPPPGARGEVEGPPRAAENDRADEAGEAWAAVRLRPARTPGRAPRPGSERAVTLVSARRNRENGRTGLLGVLPHGCRLVDAGPRRQLEPALLARCRARPRAHRRATQATSESDAEESLVQVGERLAALRKPVVLVLDDFHEIENSIVLKEVDNVLASAPPSFRLIISTRPIPPPATASTARRRPCRASSGGSCVSAGRVPRAAGRGIDRPFRRGRDAAVGAD